MSDRIKSESPTGSPRNAQWKGICYRFGISRPTAHRRYNYALSVIV